MIVFLFGAHIAGLNVSAKASAGKKLESGWIREKRSGFFQFDRPRTLNLTYTKRKTPINLNGKDKILQVHEYKQNDILIAGGVITNVPFADLFRAQCGNQIYEETIIRSEKISRPSKGYLRESALRGKNSLLLVLDGGKDSYSFLFSWPSNQDGAEKRREEITRFEIQKIVDSIQIVGARMDAGD